MDRWYALRSKPNKEWPLWRELQARRLECRHLQLRAHPVNPRSRCMRPYFPGYLFVRVDLTKAAASSLNWMPFSMGLVSFGGVPADVPDGLVHALDRRIREINAAGGEQLHGLKHGDLVVLQDGPFDGCEAIFDMRLSGSARVRLLLNYLQGRKIKLDVPVGYIQPKTTRPA